MLIESLRLDNLLSFAPDTPALELHALNVIIGANGSGKSNLIEALELLRAVPSSLAAAIRDGGGAQEWIWKGDGAGQSAPATLSVQLARQQRSSLRYGLSFAAVNHRTEVTDEFLEEAAPARLDAKDVFYYRFQGGHPVLNVRDLDSKTSTPRTLRREQLAADESVLSQRKDPDLYPELSWCAEQFAKIQTAREWSFGRYAALRHPQPADLPTDQLLADSRNLGLILNQLEHTDASATLNAVMTRFLPRFKRMTTRVQANTVQLFLHEDGLKTPTPASRLSDGTLRFLSLSAMLLMPNPPPLICIEEPELGLHPDAMTLIAELLIDASTRTQLIITTHSDALVSALTEHVESVLVCEHIGSTQLERLDAAHLAHWLARYRLGDLWRMGELGGNP